ncbi:hypothetical protein IFO70_13190 [Phormidium tenue FACHB-886]|nr:hypothetical protein [Phormidium tenue FACHB-886]
MALNYAFNNPDIKLSIKIMCSQSGRQFFKHKISEQNIKYARLHAEAMRQHGKDVEQIGFYAKKRKLFKADPEEVTENHLESIERLGQEIQLQAQISLIHTEAVEKAGGRSVRNYTALNEAHIKAVKAHVAANRLLLAAIEEMVQHRPQQSKNEANCEDKEG